MWRYRAVVFDLDGTLVDSYRPIATSLNAARAHFGKAPLPEQEIRRQVGHGLENLLAEHLGADRVDVGVRVFRERYGAIYLDETRALPGSVKAVRAAREAGIGVAVASNKPARFSAPLLERLGFAPFVQHVLGPDETIPPKPHPAMLDEAMKRLDVSARETVYVGDVPLDRETSEAAGVDLLLVPTGGASMAELEELEGARILSDLSRLLPVLSCEGAG